MVKAMDWPLVETDMQQWRECLGIGEGERTMSEEKKPTVNVKNIMGRSVTLHLHQKVADDGGGRAFQGRILDGGAVTLKAGHNASISKEFWTAWREQNSGSSLLEFLTAEDETESAERAKE